MKNNPNIILAILLLLMVAGNCSNSDTTRTSQNYATPSKTNISPTTQALSSNSPVPLKSNLAKSASVISENAALRQSPNGKVLQTLPVATSIEVIRQKGAWFYVSYGTAKGWIHGNTIRYDNQTNVSNDSQAISNIPKSDSKTSSDNDYKADKDYKPATIEKSDSSGATAKCRDGSLSYSQNRRGTCSHHGGVAVWY